MWRERLDDLSDRDRRLLGSCAAAAALCMAWALGAIIRSTDLTGAQPHIAGAQAPGGRARPPSGNPAPGVQAISLIAPQAFKSLTPAEALAANAKVPVSRLPNPPAAPFRLVSADPADHARAAACLTMAVYYEAGNQGPDGEAAVAQVVLNRLRHPFFPKTVCGVVFQGSTQSTGCQFTFSCDGSLGRRPSDDGWKRASQVAERALDGYVQKTVGEATHYHTVWVVPYWQSSVVKLTQIGAHIFYRWPGGMGVPAAFQGRYAGSETAPPPIKGFDTGLSPAFTAQVDEAPPAVPAPPPEAAPAAPLARPVEAALLTPTAAPEALAETVQPAAETPRGFFGRSGGGGQHLPVAGRW